VNISQSVLNIPFLESTSPIIPESKALAAIKASKHPIGENSSEARKAGREPA